MSERIVRRRVRRIVRETEGFLERSSVLVNERAVKVLER
jgi:hypothetical protein